MEIGFILNFFRMTKHILQVKLRLRKELHASCKKKKTDEQNRWLHEKSLNVTFWRKPKAQMSFCESNVTWRNPVEHMVPLKRIKLVYLFT